MTKSLFHCSQNILLRYVVKEHLNIAEPQNGHDFAYPRRFHSKSVRNRGKAVLVFKCLHLCLADMVG